MFIRPTTGTDRDGLSDCPPVLMPPYSRVFESGNKNRADAINSGGKLTWHMLILRVVPSIIGYGTAKVGAHSN